MGSAFADGGSFDIESINRGVLRKLVRSRILPTLEKLQLVGIRPLDVQQWVGDMEDAGLSSSRIRQAHVVLSLMLDAAVRDGIVARNAARGVKLPRLERREAAYLEAEMVDRIADAMPNEHGYDVLIRLLGIGGLRFGEAAALQRRSIDLLRRRILVEESVTEIGGRLTRGTTKSHAARGVPISKAVAKQLEDHLHAGVAAGPEASVFSRPQGGPLRLSAFYHRVWRPALSKVGLPRVGLHVLRHSAALG